MILTMSPIEADIVRQQAGQDQEGFEQEIARLERAVQPGRVATAFAIVAGVMLVMVWLGTGLSMLGILLAGWGLGLGLAYLPGVGGLGMLLMAATPLALAFVSGMEVLRLALSGPSPIMAIARNVLSEAVRMRVSVVFIVMLILLLALTPGLLKEDQPLRYRVQNWLQYGTGFSYAVLALLTLFFSTATVSFEQRDRMIWQTMVKPVRAWQYLTGKWVGVVALNAVLLSVTAGGVYLFTEYLRRQPAQGEMAYLVKDNGEFTRGRVDAMAEDRRLLETQVLVARVGRFAEPASILHSPARLEREVLLRLQTLQAQDSTIRDTPGRRAALGRELIDEFNATLDEAVGGRIRQLQNRDPNVQPTPRLRQQTRLQLLEEIERQFRSIPRGSAHPFLFVGVHIPPGASSEKLTLRYKIDAGSNDPSQIYRIGFDINGRTFVRQVGLDAAQRMLFDRELVNDDGTVELTIFNDPSNPREISFAPDGIELLYVAGGYEINFIRIMFTMWVKLAFIAAIGVAASTFLSFPVACLVTMSILFMAESSGFLSDALRDYTAMTTEGRDWVATFVQRCRLPGHLRFTRS
jgi:hypothetical protein